MSRSSVSLRRFALGDIAAVHGWFNDKEATKTLVGQRKTFSEEEAEAWTRSAIEDGEDRKYAILVEGTDEPVGFTALYGLERDSGPELGALIGGDWRNRGVGRPAEALTIAKAFGEFGAHRVYGEIPVFNEAAKSVVASLGWRYEKTLPGHGKRDQESFNCELWSVVPPDFYAAAADLALD
ncbi:MAG TPA: GNAT family N-acetyltransferase [Solirubrobacterales bacterium]|nr:GNAT family N-acetyltransferase [Solirubrobacterales bacterium]